MFGFNFIVISSAMTIDTADCGRVVKLCLDWILKVFLSLRIVNFIFILYSWLNGMVEKKSNNRSGIKKAFAMFLRAIHGDFEEAMSLTH